jgi:hypothetical protein
VPSQLRLRTHRGQGDVIFRFAHAFTTEHVPHDQVRSTFKVSSSFYQYEILDLEETEIVSYHWHPTGVSAVTTPHLHVPAAGSIVLQQRFESKLAHRKTHLGRIHFPTQHMVVEDIVESLIREFLADPLRADWEAVLNANRSARGRDRNRLESV